MTKQKQLGCYGCQQRDTRISELEHHNQCDNERIRVRDDNMMMLLGRAESAEKRVAVLSSVAVSHLQATCPLATVVGITCGDCTSPAPLCVVVGLAESTSAHGKGE